MTVSDDALTTSNIVLILISLPAFLRVCPIIIQAYLSGYLTTAGFELGWTLLIIGFGGLALAVLISVAGAFIEGVFTK